MISTQSGGKHTKVAMIVHGSILMISILKGKTFSDLNQSVLDLSFSGNRTRRLLCIVTDNCLKTFV